MLTDVRNDSIINMVLTKLIDTHTENIAVLKKRLETLRQFIRKVNDIRDDAIKEIEKRKCEFKNALVPNKTHLDRVKGVRFLPIGEKEQISATLDRDISHIQNVHVNVTFDLKKLATELQENISFAENSQLLLNLLNYRQHEIQCDFDRKLDELEEKRKHIQLKATSETSMSNIVCEVVDIEKEIEQCKDSSKLLIEGVEEQIKEVYNDYFKSISELGSCMEITQNNFRNLLFLVETEKAAVGGFKRDLGIMMEKFTKFYASCWDKRSFCGVCSRSLVYGFQCTCEILVKKCHYLTNSS